MYNLNIQINMNQLPNNNQSQKGQALLFVVIAMTVALSLGLSVSTRTLTSLRRTATTDTSARALSAAEGGIEWFLVQALQTMMNLSDGNNNSGTDCPSGSTGDSTGTSCVVTFQPQTNDSRGEDYIQTTATVNVSEFTYNESSNTNYWFNLDTGMVKEVSLRSYKSPFAYFNGTLQICWNSLDSSQSSAIYFITYGTSGDTIKRILTPLNPSPPLSIQGGTARTGSRTGYNDCYTTGTLNNLYGIRFKSLYAPSKVAVFPTGTGFPVQGFKIVSKGELGGNGEIAPVVKTVTAYRSLPYLPAVFDYAIYSNGAID
jgi:Tfp pilus assembly protein PilX